MNKRDKIITAAIDIFSKKGIEKTTVSDIVNQAGIGQGTFYLYFSSKMALMPAIAEVLVEKMHSELVKQVKPAALAEQLDETIEVMFAFTKTYKDLNKLMYSGLTQTEHVKDWETIYGPVYQWMEELLASHQQGGSLREDLNVSYIAKIVIGMIEAAAEQNYLFNEQDPALIAEYRNELKKFVNYAMATKS